VIAVNQTRINMEKKGFKPQAISPIFCDNIMLAAALPKEKILQLETNTPKIGGEYTKIFRNQIQRVLCVKLV
jgi:hypothetical protein